MTLNVQYLELRLFVHISQICLHNVIILRFVQPLISPDLAKECNDPVPPSGIGKQLVC